MDKKVERIINLYNIIVDGEVIHKAEEADRFGVNEHFIQRDLEDIVPALQMNMSLTGH